MTLKETILQMLQNKGLAPEIDQDGDIKFRFQMKTLFILVSDDDSYISILLPNFYEIEEGEEPLILAVCNKMTRELKQAKVFVDQNFKKVTSNCEFYYTNDETLEADIEHSLGVLSIVRTVFRTNKDELSK